MSRYATIVATGSYLPEIEISNDKLREAFATLPGTIDKLEAATGIKSAGMRRTIGPHPTSLYQPRARRWNAPDESRKMWI